MDPHLTGKVAVVTGAQEGVQVAAALASFSEALAKGDLAPSCTAPARGAGHENV